MTTANDDDFLFGTARKINCVASYCVPINKVLSTATAVQGLDNYKLGTATAVLPPLSRTLSRYVITYVCISNPFSYLGLF